MNTVFYITASSLIAFKSGGSSSNPSKGWVQLYDESAPAGLPARVKIMSEIDDVVTEEKDGIVMVKRQFFFGD